MSRTTLPPAVAWDEQSASAWARSTYPRLLHWVVVVAAGAGFLVGVVDDTAPCQVENPARCGPDVGFSLWFVLFVASVALLWWRPGLALLSGVVFSMADIAFDPQRWTRWAFGGYLVVCLAVTLVLVASRQRQRTAVARSAGREVVLPASVPSAPAADRSTSDPDQGFVLEGPLGDIRPFRTLRGGPAVLVAVLVLVAAGCVALYARAVAQEQTHLARALRVDAVAGGYRDGELTLTLVDPAPWMPRTVSVLPTYDVPRGAVWPVLLDPEDGDWVRTVAEPADSTWWLSIAGGAVLLAALVALRERERHRVLPALRARAHPALLVRAVRDPAGTVLVLPSGGHRVVATYRALPPVLSDEQLRALERLDVDSPLDAAPEDAGIDAITPVDAVLVGDVRDGGWAVVVTDEGVVPPLSPLRAQPSAPRLSVGDFLDAGDGEDLPSRPSWLTEVRVGGPVPDLPAEPPDTTGGRVLGWAVLVAVALGAPLATAFLVAEWHELIPVVGLAVAAGGWGAGRAVDRVRLTHEGVEVVDAWTSTFVPWGRVDEVAAGRSSVSVEWGAGGVVADLYPHVHPRDAAHARALAMAAGLRTLMDGAASAPPVPLRRRPSPAAVVLVAGAVGTAVSALLRLTP